MSSTKELLAAKEKELVSAQAAVEQWERIDLDRDSGCMAQDQRHETIGQNRSERVRDLLDEIQELKNKIEQEEAQAK